MRISIDNLIGINRNNIRIGGRLQIRAMINKKTPVNTKSPITNILKNRFIIISFSAYHQ